MTREYLTPQRLSLSWDITFQKGADIAHFTAEDWNHAQTPTFFPVSSDKIDYTDATVACHEQNTELDTGF